MVSPEIRLGKDKVKSCTFRFTSERMIKTRLRLQHLCSIQGHDDGGQVVYVVGSWPTVWPEKNRQMSLKVA